MDIIPLRSQFNVLINPLEWGATTYVALIVASLLLRLRLPSSPTRLMLFLREFLLIAPAALFYFLVRGLVDAREADAVRHARQVIDLEVALGIDWEGDLQDWLMRSERLIDLVNWVYIWAHWPLIIVTMTWLILERNERFPHYRNAFLIAGAIGMVIFALYPVAPPRLMPELGFVDTVTERSNSYRVLQPPSLTNPYAAMPSLHFGWNLLMGIAIVQQTRHRAARVFGVLMPLAMLASIILTANHYILDGVAGAAIILLSLAISQQIPTTRSQVATRHPTDTSSDRAVTSLQRHRRLT